MTQQHALKDQTLQPHEVQTILLIASRILSYPEAIDEMVETISESIDEQIDDPELKKELTRATQPLFVLPARDLRELYVNTFDLKSKLGLYLTAHEFGDSPKRGAALIKLQKIVNQTGFEREGEELADYIPMLLELLAVAPELREDTRLYRRLAVAMQFMIDNIAMENPYGEILRVLTRHIFPEPTEEDIKEIEFNREEADLEELPFPMMYQ
ncbi:putative nitrate reductase molybdenum cofactor assembly chaperone NarJ [Lentibacillus sp. JNUCC-1]|uniref:nitrate reductase molybdenum cofactor assembly chaperone n=1 Tax=Lentibacillus sp. JNUCC-1 TaxID=2654513 RepID=UPI0012E73B0E|nr:nitrate reductase molybdenum cofactor assembly chaperone [Lentibacillus sp. JNUCC-1]MUV36736.1 putative nitrate reductase molybdenum cofactor assembly chaperone NarJ [Lentibacillus sp. JNUCC-1]